MIDFEDEFSNKKLDEFELSVTRESKVIGCMGVKLYCTKEDKVKWTENVFFLIDLEPLSENPFGTPGGYVKPWYSFAAGDNAATILENIKKEFRFVS
jgi:hypothetical protein